jgi:hypothetical protein
MKMEQSDLDDYAMRDAADGTGIREYLEAKGKKFFALTPTWKDDQKKEIVFWLNPVGHLYNFGWFTVQDLVEWGKEEGRVIIARKDSKK